MISVIFTCCKTNKEDTIEIDNKLLLIENHLSISSDSLGSNSVINRLDRIIRKLESKNEFNQMIFVTDYDDTIVNNGKPFSFTVIHHTFNAGYEGKAIIYENENSILEKSSTRGLFDFNISNYKIGPNKFDGYIMSEDDSLYFNCSFYVK